MYLLDAKLFLRAVTLCEIQADVEITREQDVNKAAEIEAWLDLVAASYKVLPMVAATANLHGLTAVTRNVADFKSFGVALLNPFAKANS